MTQDDPFFALVGPVRDSLKALATTGSAVRAERSLPAVDSQGMTELARESEFDGLWGASPLVTIFGGASVLLFAVEDHLTSLAAMFDAEPVPVFSHLAVARAALESAARARWLLERTAGVRGRVARGLASRCADLDARSQLGLADNRFECRSRELLIELLEECERRGFAHRSKKDNLVLNEGMPGNTRLVRQLFEHSPFARDEDSDLPGVMYSYYSAVVHGQTYGLMESVDRATVERNPLQSTAQAHIVTTGEGVVSAMAIAAAGYIEAVDEQTELLGWTNADWTQVRLESLAAISHALRRGSS